MIRGIPWPSLNTFPWPNLAGSRGRLYLLRIIFITALKANCPRQRIAFRSLSESISLARYREQLLVSAVDGLLSGGAHLTAAVTYASFSLSASSELSDMGCFARPTLQR